MASSVHLPTTRLPPSLPPAGEHVQCIHPGAACIAGREAVLEGWRLVLGSGRLRIKLQDVRVYAGERWVYSPQWGMSPQP